MDTVSFLTRVLPRGGLKILAELVPYTDKKTGETKEGWRYKTFDSIEVMAEAVAQYNDQERTIYHACNGYGDWYVDEAKGKRRLRTGVNVQACRSIYDDIDIGKEGCYASTKEAMAAVKGFIADTGLPSPLVVYSGGGIHLYWTMTDDVTPEQWLELSTMKRRLTAFLGLKVDRAVDTDLARVLRPVGSLNFKYDTPRPVVQKNDPASTDYAELRSRLEAAIEKLQAPEIALGKPSRSVNNVFAAALETNFPDSYPDIIAEHCATIRWFKETGCSGEDMEPLWHKCVGAIKVAVGGPEKIHEWSSKYSGYSESETQEKIDAWTYGPTSCAVIKSMNGNKCDGCNQKCSYPIQLGQRAETSTPEFGEDPEVVEGGPEEQETKEELLRKNWPSGFSINEKKQLCRAVRDDNNVIVNVPFCDTVFYPINLIQNEEGEWEVTVEYRARHGKLRTFQMATSCMSSADKLATALAAHTILIFGKGGGMALTEFMRQHTMGLQAHKLEVITEEAFGWTPDGNSFIIGNKKISPTGEDTVLLSEHINRGGMAKDFGLSGTRNQWVHCVDEVYNRPGAELYQFAFLVAAASPLIELVNIDGFNGIPVAYTGDGGRGKTTTCRLACSMWGKGELFVRSANSSGSTINGILARTGIFKHLPWVMDEMTGQKTEELADMLFALSNGQGKTRLGADGSFAGGSYTWRLFSFITGNMDITGLLATLDRQKSEAVSVRCFEIKVPADYNETVFKGVDFKQLVDVKLNGNYGYVGRELIRFYIKNRVKITEGVHKLRQKYSPVTADQTRERFYIDLLCFALVAGRCMEKLGLIKFDLENLKKAMLANVKKLRIARTERQFTGAEMVGSFITSLHEHTIITKTITDGRRSNNAEIPMDTLRGEPLARKATVDKRFVVTAKAIQDWGRENNVAPSLLRNELDKQGFILHIKGKGDETGAFNWRIGTGTTRTTGLSRCFELDYAKVHGFESEETVKSATVTAIRPAVQESVPENETAPEGAAVNA